MERIKADFSLDQLAQAEWWAWKADTEAQKLADELEIEKERGKEVLAAVMTALEKTHDEMKMSESKLERLTRVEPQWAKYRENFFELTRKAGEARIKAKCAQRFFDCVQSGLSYKRAELGRLS